MVRARLWIIEKLRVEGGFNIERGEVAEIFVSIQVNLQIEMFSEEFARSSRGARRADFAEDFSELISRCSLPMIFQFKVN